MEHSNNCCVIMAIVGIVWWLVASGLVTLTWNRVIGGLTKVKEMKFWQAALLLLTIGVVFCLPNYMKHKGCCGKGHCIHGDCPTGSGESTK